jgi:hypothetical protein
MPHGAWNFRYLMPYHTSDLDLLLSGLLTTHTASTLSFVSCLELELELIQTQMTQKPMLRAEVYARALRASQNRKEDSV